MTSTIEPTPAQRRTWVLERLAPGSRALVVASAVRVETAPTIDTLRRALDKAADRHDVLGWRFVEGAGGGVEIRSASAAVALELVETNEPLEIAVRSWCARTAPFDLERGPVVRGALISTRDGGAGLALAAHALVADERSLEILAADALAVARGLTPAEPSRSFADHARVQNAAVIGGAFAAAVEHVRGAVAAAGEPLEIPGDRPRPPVQSQRAGTTVLSLSREASDAVRRLSAETGASPGGVLVAALAALIGRYTRLDAVVVGVATDGRSDGALARTVGPLGGAVPLLVSLGGSPTVREVCARVALDLASLEPHRDVPLAVLLHQLGPERDPGRAPFFQVVVSYRARAAGELVRIPAPMGASPYDLAVTIDDDGTDVAGTIGWAEDLFDAATVERVRGHLDVLLRGMGEDPAARMASLPILTGGERAQVVEEGRTREFPGRTPIHRLVEAQVGRSPAAVAVTCEGKSLTYAELDRKADGIARWLRARGVKRDVLVAVLLDRSVELIPVLLGILKSGGAYVPIEPTNPRERIDFVLEDAQVAAVISERSQLDKLGNARTPVLLLEDALEERSNDTSRMSAGPAREPEPDFDSLAYVIYTSGSTGKPKGCLIEHRHVTRLFEATEAWYGFGPDDVWTLFHSVAFDFSVWEIWGALIYGGRVVVVPYWITRSPEDFYRLVSDERVTVLNQTPSAFRSFVQAEASVGVLPLALRTVIFGGEALELESLRPWFDRHGDEAPRLVNMYGITETTVHVTYRPISRADLDPTDADAARPASVIGRPIPDLSVYVVDAGLQLAPVGVPGEMLVGGAGVARGYLERPELTSERFIPDTLSGRPGAKLYRSGDLARRLPNGELDYLGRIDHQVKIRGHRIETGEIEAVLRRTGLVRDVAVLPHRRSAHETMLVAYVVSDVDAQALRAGLRAHVPEYMVPSAFVKVDRIPMTSNGKVHRRALPAPDAEHAGTGRPAVLPKTQLEEAIAAVWRDVLGAASVGVEDAFFDVGGTSLGVVEVAKRLRERLGMEVPVVKLFQHPTIAALAKALGGARDSAAGASRGQGSPAAWDEPIAIVGMAGRFPGAPSVEALWQVLVEGRDTITFFGDGELDPAVDPAVAADPAYVRGRGILEGAELFDAGFFGMSPREAEITDPQQRILLELAWEALESSGHDPATFPGLVGVYAGEFNDSYYLENVLERPEIVERVGAFQAMAGNEKDFVATRIAHKLDLKGPALSIHTACSTSLVAVANAFWALRTRQCDLALAGGAAVTYPQKAGYLYQEGSMLSADGHTRAFDADARGTVFSDGAGMVVLRRLSDAIAAGDRIWAVIRGAAMNNDGGMKMSFTAPSVDGQADVIRMALDVAGVHPDTVSYIEAHGTATPLGDPIEVEGMTQAFRARTDRKQFCAIGSVKSNLGHMTAAAGVAGLIKTALAMDRGELPASIHFKVPNPKIDFSSSPFFVNHERRPWTGPSPRRAGVSSFGVGGTNAHVVVEEAPRPAEPAPSWPKQLLLLSARTSDAVTAAARRLADHLRAAGVPDLADSAFTLQTGRRAFAHRRFCVAATPEEAAKAFSGAAGSGAGVARDRPPPVVLVFPGQGSQYVGMGRDLAAVEPRFRATVDRCAEILEPILGRDLRDVMWADPSDAEAAGAILRQTWITQPALFTIEYAIACLLCDLGIEPETMIGHSVGEFVAACVAGVMSLEDALGLVAVRGRMMQDLPGGSMLSVRRPAAEVEAMLGSELAIGAINSRELCVVSGPTGAVDALAVRLEKEGVACSRLHTSHAFHSAMMDPIVEPFAERVRAVRLSPPRIRFTSTVTARPITDAEATDPGYWARHLRATVRFSDAILDVWKSPERVLCEAGPRTTAATLARQHATDPKKQLAVSTLEATSENHAEVAAFLKALGQLWVAGVAVDWKALHGEAKRRRVVLPTYPFERKRHFVDPPAREAASPVAPPPIVMVSAPAAPVPAENGMSTNAGPGGRRARILDAIRTTFEEASGIELGGADAEATFVELGLDSLSLTQCAQLLGKRVGVKVTFRQLIEDLTTLSAVADKAEQDLPPTAFSEAPAPAPSTPTPTFAVPAMAFHATGSTATGPIQQLVAQQLQIMARQLELLSGSAPALAAAIAPSADVEAVAPGPPPSGALTNGVSALAADEPAPKKPFGPGARIEKTGSALPPEQQRALDDFIARYIARTPKSKAFAQENRHHLADPRAVTGFKPMWKEIVYPIVVERSLGSKLWDIDGNEWVDVTCGFGANFLGHRPPFVVEAVHQQLDRGFEIGPQHPLVADCARLVTELTGLERVAFCNTGSEAVLGATRLARTVTGRPLIVTFTGDYHGILDEVILRGTKAQRSIPASPGILPSAVQNNLVLEYGSQSALEIIAQRAEEIAAVVVEPIQSRRPDLQPRQFLHDLRKLTKDKGIALVFDEIITGFRLAPGGAQEYYGVRADLATYGKILGGGLPIGAIAGSHELMDALDGGKWQFGDSSVPEVGVTYFAGTFVRHPLALAACKAALEHVKRESPGLQHRINAKNDKLVADISDFFRRREVPFDVSHCSSWFKLGYPDDLPFGGLIFFWLRLKGVHIWDGRVAFLTIAHGDDDIDFITRAFEETIVEMQDAGFLPKPSSPDASARLPPVAGARLGRDQNGQPAWFVPDPTPVLEPVDFDPFADGEILDTAPATAAQIEVWVSAQMGDDASCAYNESVTLTCLGRLDERAMRESLNALVARHEGLRTTFSRDGKTLCVGPPFVLEAPLVDLGDRGEDARQTALSEMLQREVTTPFDLEHGPLFRACIVRMGDDDHRVVMTAHHIVCDGWSFAVLFQDLGAFYSAKHRGASPELKEVHRFSDYARAERVGGAEHQETEAYWLSQYQGSIPVVDLPTDRPRAKMRSYTSERFDYVLPKELVAALKKTGAKAGASFFVTMFTAFAALMSRLSGQSDIVVGIPAAGQSAVGKEMLVGHCANLLPVRVRVDAEHTLADALKAARKVVLDAYDHQRYTFGSLLSKLPIARDPSRIPLAPILFNIDVGMEGSGLKFEGLEVSFAGNPRAFENFEIFVNGVESKGAVTLETQYSTALWDRETIEARLAAFEALLRAIVEHPDERVWRMPVVSVAERKRLIVDWNDTRVDVPAGATVDSLFEAQAARTPDRIAVQSGADRATYSELDARANRVAAHLAKLGVGRGALVGLCVERSIDMVAGLLGILKTGAAYVPMDPEFPRSRLAHMVGDAKVGLVLSQRTLEDVVPEGPRVVSIDDEAIARESSSRPAARAAPGDRAYVIYTSGSTGLPKGVELQHSAVVSFLTTMKQRPGLSPDDVLMAVTTLSFDIAVLELLLPLVAGATTVVCSREVASDGYQLLDALRDTKATVMQATPATWRLLIAAGWSGGVRVLCGGEALPPDLARTLVERAGTVWNLYGPTETTVWSTCQEISERDPRVVIGRPIGNTTCYVLDARRELVPAGIPGELWIGGSGVALGYLGRAELTAERFVTDPFSPATGARMYRTGDVVRWQRDGVLEYLSRNDDQVKVRGYRIELGEIEAVLADHPAVVEGAVALVEERPGEVRVTGYVVLKAGEELTVTEVRRHLRKKLPDYMIPNGIVEIPSLPRTPNGKIDRKALAAVSRPTRPADVAVPPRTAAERLVAEVWQSALRVDRVGVHDNFYELGGDSLTSMDMVVRIQQRTRVRISPRAVLLDSLEQIARVVESSAVVG